MHRLAVTPFWPAGDERSQHQDVWATTVLSDGTMVSGDSSGNVQLWDASHGTLLTGFRQHCADVLALAASPDGTTLFACGADPQVAIFRRGLASSGESLCLALRGTALTLSLPWIF